MDCAGAASRRHQTQWLWTFDSVTRKSLTRFLMAACDKFLTGRREDILQLKSYQDEWDRTQRAIELAKREQVAKEVGVLDEL